MIFPKKNQEGFVALFTVLITTVVLAMAIGIASLSLKEIVLSSTASDGNKAFYAADSGIECALYWERANQIPTSLFSGMRCNNLLPLEQDGPTGSDPEVYTFSIPFGEVQDAGDLPPLCADVKIERDFRTGSFSTRIESKGSNVPCDDTTNPKKVERSIRVTY